MVPVSEGLYKYLNAWFQICERQGEPTSRLDMKDWFITADGDDRTEPMNIDHLTYRWTKATEAVGLKDFPFKAFRSLAATRLLASGISPVDAAQWLGHASPSMTLNVYGRGTTPGKLQIMAVLDQATMTEGIFLSATSGDLGPDRLGRQRTSSILDKLEGGIDEEIAVSITKPGAGLPGTPQEGMKSIWDGAPPILAPLLDVENEELRRILED